MYQDIAKKAITLDNSSQWQEAMENSTDEVILLQECRSAFGVVIRFSQIIKSIKNGKEQYETRFDVKG